MDNKIRWLLAEIDRWQAEGLVSTDQADQLRARYDQPPAPAAAIAAPAAPKESVPWGLLVFATAGAIVIGLGVILLFAYNWDEIPKFGKLALIFGAVIGTHLIAARFLAKEGWQPKLGEALAALGTMFYGAGIWLVAQVYHIDEHYPNGFLFWALGALAMAWAIRSTANGLLAVVLLTIWGCVEVVDFRSPESGALLLVAGGLLPLAWRQRSALLLAATLAALQLLFALNFVNWGGGSLTFTVTLAWAVLLVALSRLVALHRPDYHGAPAVLAFFGFGAFFVCAYLLSFRGAADTFLDWDRRARGLSPIPARVFAWALFGTGLAAWGWLARAAFLRRLLAVNREDWLLPIALAYCFLIAVLGVQGWDLFVSWSFNLMLLGVAVMWMWRGCQQSLLGTTVIGSLLLSVVVLARYFDLFQSLASRGFAFIILGGIFLAEAFYYRKVRKETGGDA